MPVFRLSEEHIFPPAELASEDGVLAVGGDTDPDRLLLAYQNGIFPWPHEDLPLLWFSPNPRFVLEPKKAKISHSLRKALKQKPYHICADKAFDSVIKRCATVSRRGQHGTWITDDMMAGYFQLHKMGYAHSIEAYLGDTLVGGLYGVSLGGVFFGESMFADMPDASKICFAVLLKNLVAWGFDLVDCQSYTDHLARFGAEHWPRIKFLHVLQNSLKKPTKRGEWKLDPT